MPEPPEPSDWWLEEQYLLAASEVGVDLTAADLVALVDARVPPERVVEWLRTR